MSFNRDQPSARSPLSNKEETELPVGEPQEPASRDHSRWRCHGCGEMGEFGEALPTNCPGCDGPRENLYVPHDD